MAIPQPFAKPTDILQSNARECMKMHIAFDGSNRMVTIWECPIGAENGDPAMKTSYEYVGATNRISGMKEEMSSWDSSWDF